jgi:hypothetical protein
MEALVDIPELEAPLVTEKGEAFLQKTDIFKKTMWFGYKNENTWITVGASRVSEVIELNKKGKKPATLLENEEADIEDTTMALNSDLEELDRKFKKKTKRKNRKKKRFKPRRKNPGNE